ncbi:MAG: NADH-quinone oxidoreductase subunit L [Rhodospirillaceae bacterium]|nr:MAG: NADH-quinone oxidoreductase subunit L [Rhodospirillaceae bacterium]
MLVAAVFLPLLGALIAGVFGRLIGNRGAHVVTCLGVGLAALCAIPTFFDVAIHGHSQVVPIAAWLSSGTFEAAWALRFDTLSATMVMTVTCVSTLIHVYSVGYMSHDDSQPRFMAYLSAFTFAMLMLVTADNLVQLFFGWEGVGVMSYLLIGFWYKKPSACAAAIKAFIVNRVGDFGFLLGIFAVYYLFDSVNFDTIFAAAPDKADSTVTFFSVQWHALTITCLLLFVGAMGKSAQLFLHTWLPDAMEGPTPVSALIHAATMVTAGVFLVARMSPLFEFAPTALAFVTVIGASTAFFAGTVGCVQNDIKRIIAYSTCSQLGYMFMACGVSAYQAGVFHLMTHAWFKALLFLSAGSVIHALSDEQDIRKMGGIWRLVPVTTVVMTIGNLALTGIPPFAGYYSKDTIIEAAHAAGTASGDYAYVLALIVVLLTSFYSWRLTFLTFFGKSRVDHHTMEHAHESPLIMLVPLGFLAVGAVIAGMVGYHNFVGEDRAAFWRGAIKVLANHDSIGKAHEEKPVVVLEYLPLFLSVLGFVWAYMFYIRRPDLPGKLAATFPGVHRFLLNKWYFDELYDWMFVRPAFRIGRLFWKGGDGAVIDGLGPDGISTTVVRMAQRLGVVQSGYLYHYAFAMIVGIALVVTWIVVPWAHWVGR